MSALRQLIWLARLRWAGFRRWVLPPEERPSGRDVGDSYLAGRARRCGRSHFGAAKARKGATSHGSGMVTVSSNTRGRVPLVLHKVGGLAE